MNCDCGREINGSTSDGYHTFDQLYEHRCMLFCALSKHEVSWKSRKNSAGEIWEGWFIAGIELKSGQISYHLPESMWEMFQGDEKEVAPWDGHTADDVIKRLNANNQ